MLFYPKPKYYKLLQLGLFLFSFSLAETKFGLYFNDFNFLIFY